MSTGIVDKTVGCVDGGGASAVQGPGEEVSDEAEVKPSVVVTPIDVGSTALAVDADAVAVVSAEGAAVVPPSTGQVTAASTCARSTAVHANLSP